MGLAAVRRSSRAIAVCLLIVSIWGFPHRAQGDDACGPLSGAQHDESKHVIGGATPADHDEHCAVCHWLRSLKPGLAGRSASGSNPTLSSPLAAVAGSPHRDPAGGQLPARAPPSSLS